VKTGDTGRIGVTPRGAAALRRKEKLVHVSARLTSERQITIPKPVRKALELKEGDEISFVCSKRQETITQTQNLGYLATA
jgi:AbrB family looped-hinge helix DNA binding protein